MFAFCRNQQIESYRQETLPRGLQIDASQEARLRDKTGRSSTPRPPPEFLRVDFCTKFDSLLTTHGFEPHGLEKYRNLTNEKNETFDFS